MVPAFFLEVRQIHLLEVGRIYHTALHGGLAEQKVFDQRRVDLNVSPEPY